jgi:hypothetical protein
LNTIKPSPVNRSSVPFVDEVDLCDVRMTQTAGALDDRPEDGVGIRGRPRQRGQDLAGRDQLLLGVDKVPLEPSNRGGRLGRVVIPVGHSAAPR